MIVNSAGKPWTRKTWTGQWLTHPYTVRPSLAQPNQLLAVCKMTTRQLTSCIIPTICTWGGSQSYQHGQHFSLPTTPLLPGPPHRRYAAASTIDNIDSVTGIGNLHPARFQWDWDPVSSHSAICRRLFNTDHFCYNFIYCDMYYGHYEAAAKFCQLHTSQSYIRPPPTPADLTVV